MMLFWEQLITIGPPECIIVDPSLIPCYRCWGHKTFVFSCPDSWIVIRHLSVPQDWVTPSCYVKTRVVISNYALRSWAAGPLGPGSISPDQRHRTRFPLGKGPVSPRVPEKKALRAKCLGPGPSTGSRTPTYYPDPSTRRE